jgi:hypothetical protein
LRVLTLGKALFARRRALNIAFLNFALSTLASSESVRWDFAFSVPKVSRISLYSQTHEHGTMTVRSIR